MRIRKVPLLLSIVLVLIMLPTLVLAEDKTTFSLNSPTDIAQLGDEVFITIEGQNINDVYGYELRLSYNPKLMTFHKASTIWEGFSVPPIVEDGSIVFAHTKVGNVKGESDDVSFATLHFEAIGLGDAHIQLTRVKLVDSKGGSITLEPDVALEVKVPTGRSADYTDIKGHWAEADIVRATEMGWINGYPDGTFGPNKEVTRAQFTTMLSRALALSTQIDMTDLFDDHTTIPDYAKVHVSQAAAAGIIKGYEDHTFKPSRWITRSEITVMLMRVIGYEDNVATSSLLTYSDADQVPEWAYPAVAKATELNIVKGRANDKFVPNGSTTRAEAVTLILRILDHQAE